MTLWPGLTRKETWRRYCDKPPRVQPERLTVNELHALGDDARVEYDESRLDWHPNMPFIKTPQLIEVHRVLKMIVDCNRQESDRIRGAGAIDAFAGLGKTTIADTFGRDFDRHEIRRHGPETDAGHPRLPVFKVGISANTTLKSLNERICQFYGHPAMKKHRHGYSADRLAGFALDCILSSETKIGIIDDVHFVTPQRKDGQDVINHLKFLNSEFPITFLFAGVDLEGKGFFRDPQLASRWTRLGVAPFEIGTDEGRAEWQRLIKSTERQVVLAHARPGMLTRHADYLFARTGGHIGSFFSLVSRGAWEAIRSGEEDLTRELLDDVLIDAEAESGRRELEAAIAAGLMTAQPAHRRTRRTTAEGPEQAATAG